MKNKELLLTNLPNIIGLNESGIPMSRITLNFNEQTNSSFTPNYIRDSIYKLRTNKLNKSFDFFTMLDASTAPIEIAERSVYKHGLFISTHLMFKDLQVSHLILTSKNFTKNCTSIEALIYAKRLLRQYQIEDREMISDKKRSNPEFEDSGYIDIIRYLHQNFDEEVKQLKNEIKLLSIKIAETNNWIY